MKAKVIGKCIYCLAEKVPLSREHVIPFSMGGQSTLQQASCEECAEITKKIIGRVCSGENSIFGNARTVLKLPSRRIKERKTEVLQTSINVISGIRNNRIVKAEKLIHSVFLPLYSLPGCMRGVKISEGIESTEAITLNANTQIANPNEVYLTIHRGDIRDLGMFVALEAYCSAVNEYGLEKTKKSPLRDLIIGNRADLGNWVGTAIDYQMRQINKVMDVAFMSCINGHTVARIKFFAWIDDLPEYIAVVF